jgi:predicted PurR-regulated permease PerM
VRTQVTFRTAFTVCFAVVATVAAVRFVLETRLAVTLTVSAMMAAIALDHVVRRMEARGLERAWAILVTMAGVGLLIVALVAIVVPAAVHQAQELVAASPRILDSVRHAPWNQRFGVEESLKHAFSGATVDPVVTAVGSVLRAVAGFLTVLALTAFMLVFGGGLVRALLAVVPAVDRQRWEDVFAKSYTAVGGYLGGVLFICSVNATITTVALSLIGGPYFVPLGLLGGFSSLVPYVGPIFTGAFITLVTLATGGAFKAAIALSYFVLYGQLEASVLGPFVFRRTVHLNPLVTLLSVLFLAELLGVPGAVVAVPAIAVIQIFVRELVAARREYSAGGQVLPSLFAPDLAARPIRNTPGRIVDSAEQEVR